MAELIPDEKALLLATLNNQREHILGILDGLSDDDLERAVLPSGWTCLGLVQHLALDVERWWFWRVVAGEEDLDEPTIESAWQVAHGAGAAAVLDLYRREVERADGVIETLSLEAEPQWWPEEQFGTWRLHNLRHVMLHVIAETACHAGHLDAVRELIDGKRWLVLDASTDVRE